VKFVLFALTGIGNVVLRTLLDRGIRPDLLITREEKGAYPYEPIPFIGDLASSNDVPWNTCSPDDQSFASCSDGLLLVATYHRIIRRNVLLNFRTAINLHPSLLPHNRGSNPFFWSLRNGDKSAGVSAHALTEGVDDGPICMQVSIDVGPNETQTLLRHRLAHVAGKMSVDIVNQFRSETLVFKDQDARFATSYPRLDEAAFQIDTNESADQIRRHVNALRDWPLALLGGRRVRRLTQILEPSFVEPGTILSENSTEYVVRVGDADIVLELDNSAAGNL
jgi:methionyl-tRNA formyltransferase